MALGQVLEDRIEGAGIVAAHVRRGDHAGEDHVRSLTRRQTHLQLFGEAFARPNAVAGDEAVAEGDHLQPLLREGAVHGNDQERARHEGEK